jgi:membrane-associated phospholipid phosphatase
MTDTGTSLDYWWRAYLRLIAIWLLFLVVYWGTAWITSNRQDVAVIQFEWERDIPFLPWMIVPYLSIGVFCVALPFLGLSHQALDAFMWRMAAATIMAGACFLAFPLQLAESRPSVPGRFGMVYEMVKAADPPHNLFPSLHVTLLLIIWTTYRRSLPGLSSLLLHAWFSLVFVSVLFVRQHHFIDVVGGAVVAIVCIAFLPPCKTPPDT